MVFILLYWYLITIFPNSTNIFVPIGQMDFTTNIILHLPSHSLTYLSVTFYFLNIPDAP